MTLNVRLALYVALICSEYHVKFNEIPVFTQQVGGPTEFSGATAIFLLTYNEAFVFTK